MVRRGQFNRVPGGGGGDASGAGVVEFEPSEAALPRSRLEGVLWWLVGHRLRLAHKERGREGESGTKQRGLSENPGVCLPRNVHPASQTVVSIVIQERPRRRKKKRKKGLTMPCRGDVVWCTWMREGRQKMDPARRDNTATRHPGRTRGTESADAPISANQMLVLAVYFPSPGRRVVGSLT